jgi:hypothetical protein
MQTAKNWCGGERVKKLRILRGTKQCLKFKVLLDPYYSVLLSLMCCSECISVCSDMRDTQSQVLSHAHTLLLACSLQAKSPRSLVFFAALSLSLTLTLQTAEPKQAGSSGLAECFGASGLTCPPRSSTTRLVQRFVLLTTFKSMDYC